MLPLELVNRNAPQFAHVLESICCLCALQSGSHSGTHSAIILTSTAVIMGSVLTPCGGINVTRLFIKKIVSAENCTRMSLCLVQEVGLPKYHGRGQTTLMACGVVTQEPAVHGVLGLVLRQLQF